MKTTFTNEANNLIMAFEGRLDTAASAQTEKDMKVLHDCDGKDITLDREVLVNDEFVQVPAYVLHFNGSTFDVITK